MHACMHDDDVAVDSFGYISSGHKDTHDVETIKVHQPSLSLVSSFVLVIVGLLAAASMMTVCLSLLICNYYLTKHQQMLSFLLLTYICTVKSNYLLHTIDSLYVCRQVSPAALSHHSSSHPLAFTPLLLSYSSSYSPYRSSAVLLRPSLPCLLSTQLVGCCCRPSLQSWSLWQT